MQTRFGGFFVLESQMPDVVEQTPEQTRESAEAAFAAVSDPAAAVAAEPKPEVKEEPKKDDKPAVAADAAAPAAEVKPDPWEGVSPVIKEQFGEMGKRFDSVMHHLKSTDGRLGAMQKAMTTARQDVAKTGGDAPTQQQVAAAASSTEKWQKLEADFPEWTAALTERMAADRAAITAEITGKMPKQIDVAATVKPMFAAVKDEVLELFRIEAKHDGWKETVNTPKFINWSYQGGPTAAERMTIHQLESVHDAAGLYKTEEQHVRDTERASAILRSYPQWWADRGVLLDSNKAKDAIKLLDAFKEASKTAAAQTPDPKQQETKKRLEAAIPARGTPSARQPTISEREAAEQAFAAA